MSDNLLVYGIHQVQETTILVKIGAVINHVLDPRIVNLPLWYLSKPVIFDTAEF
jgi:hypothetical protein